MVTCQSANQLKTPAKVSWAFKMVSPFGSRLHNHGEDCWSDSCPETIIDILHKEGKLQTFITKEAGCSQSAVSKHVNRKLRVFYYNCILLHFTSNYTLYNYYVTNKETLTLSGRKKCGRKRCTTSQENHSLWGLSSKIDSRIWVNFTRNGLRLGSRHQEHTLQLSSEAS